MSRRRTRAVRRSARGSAVVDFVLVMVVLVPLFLGILQVALVMYVRTSLTAAASEGARYGATLGHTPADGAARTREQIDRTLSGRYAGGVSAGLTRTGGAPTVVVRVAADVPPLGMWGPGLHLVVAGHATREVP